MLRAVFDHSARRFARKTTISRVGSSVQTCYQRTKTDNAGDQIPESIESHSGIHYRPPLVGFLSVEIQARPARTASTYGLFGRGPKKSRTPTTGDALCCARAAYGHAAMPQSPAMNSRRRISDLPRLDRQ